MYHVVSQCNPADLATRPGSVKYSDVGPNRKWEKGLPWMKENIAVAVKNGILTPISKLRLNKEEENNYKKGMVLKSLQKSLPEANLLFS